MVGKILMAEIQGQTVKNYIVDITGFRYGAWSNTITDINDTNTIIYEILQDHSTTSKFMLQDDKGTNGWWEISKVKGLHRLNVSGSRVKLCITTSSEMRDILGEIYFGKTTDAEKVTYPNFYGLSSTEATIEVNGTKHSFYEPTIKGETKVVDGKLVSLESTDASLPKLGSTPSVSDTLDRASGVLSGNTKEIVLGDGTYIKNNTKQYYVRIDRGIVGEYPINTGLPSGIISLRVHPTEDTMLLITTDDATDSAELVKNAFKSNPTTVRYQLATPITTQLTPQQVDTYSQHKKVILLNGSGGSNSSLELTEDGECIWVDKYKKFLLNGSENFGAIIENVKTVRVALGMTQHGVKNMANGNCDKIPYLIGDSSDTQHCRIDGSGGLLLWINKSNLNSLTLDGVKEFISKNNILLELELATPTTTHIPKSLTPTIPLNKINILSNEE